MSKKIIRVPHNSKKDYDDDFIDERRKWLSEKTGVHFAHLKHYKLKGEDVRGNIENFIGVSHVPVGVVGPLEINGDHAQGTFYVPFATTEGAMVSTYQRGAIAVTKSGGARTKIVKDQNNIAPVFILSDLNEAIKLQKWTVKNFDILKEKVSEVTSHGQLTKIEPFIIGRRIVLKFCYFTQDAMGANMINIATERLCKFVIERAKSITIERYLLRSNMSSEKKVSAVNLLSGYGKEVLVEARLPARIVKRHLNSSVDDISEAWHSWAAGSFQSGMMGINAHYANGLAGIFICCGQDVAHVTNASVGITTYEKTRDGDLYISIKLPNIIVGTVGGGTALGSQKECLEMIGCYGQGKSKKFAEVVAATLLAGEIGICAGITSDEFLAPHVRARVYTKAKSYTQE